MNHFKENSYKAHEVHYEKHHDTRKEQSWASEDTVDFWRHHRMYSPLLPLLKARKNSQWLTIGDGRFGLDAIRLKKLEGSLEILPTDISSYLLEQAYEKKLIDDYRIENAESLSFENEEFDFAFCKESYHHFPRPMLALYEMLRVARQGIVLIEPNDFKPVPVLGILNERIKILLKRIVGWRTNAHSDQNNYEEVGNYVYTLSVRELEKAALGLNASILAYKYFNDYYEEGIEYEQATPDSKLFKKVISKIKRADLKCRMKLQNYGLIIAIIFKSDIETKLKKELAENDFKVVELPKNPYL